MAFAVYPFLFLEEQEHEANMECMYSSDEEAEGTFELEVEGFMEEGEKEALIQGQNATALFQGDSSTYAGDPGYVYQGLCT